MKRLHLKEAVEPHNVWSIINKKKKDHFIPKDFPADFEVLRCVNKVIISKKEKEEKKYNEYQRGPFITKKEIEVVPVLWNEQPTTSTQTK